MASLSVSVLCFDAFPYFGRILSHHLHAVHVPLSSFQAAITLDSLIRSYSSWTFYFFLQLFFSLCLSLGNF